MSLTGSSIRLWRVCFHFLFVLDHFEFRISHFSETYIYRYLQTYLGSYQISMIKFLLLMPNVTLVTGYYLLLNWCQWLLTRYFGLVNRCWWLLLVTTCYFWFLVLATTICLLVFSILLSKEIFPKWRLKIFAPMLGRNCSFKQAVLL